MKIFRGSTGSGKTTKMFEYAKENFEGKKVGVISEGFAELNERIKGFDFTFVAINSDLYSIKRIKDVVEKSLDKGFEEVDVIVIDGAFKDNAFFELFELEQELDVTILATAQTIFSERHKGVSIINLEMENMNG